MKKRDARKLTPAELYDLRKRYILLRKQGLTNRAAAASVGISETRACAIWQRYEGDVAALKPKNRGRQKGDGRKLSVEQEADIRELLVSMLPDELGFDVHLWTRESVRSAIKERHKIDISPRSITDYLSRWGVKQIKFTYALDEKEFKSYKKWLKSDYKEVLLKSKNENCNIYWLFVKELNGFEINCDKRVILLSAIANQGQIRFMLNVGRISDKTLIDFISRLTKDSLSKIFLFLKNEELFESELVKRYLSRAVNKNKIELFCVISD